MKGFGLLVDPPWGSLSFNVISNLQGAHNGGFYWEDRFKKDDAQ